MASHKGFPLALEGRIWECPKREYMYLLMWFYGNCCDSLSHDLCLAPWGEMFVNWAFSEWMT